MNQNISIESDNARGRLNGNLGMQRVQHHNAKEGVMGIWECQEQSIIMLNKV